MSTVSALSTGIVPPVTDDTVEVPRSASPCSSDSGSSLSSGSDSSTWTPTGVYIPIHRRAWSGASSATSVSSSSRSSKVALPHTSHHEAAKPHPRVYTREELLALAPTSLVHASLHPIINPELLAKHPRILRARGDGIARALDMARQSSVTHQHNHQQHHQQHHQQQHNNNNFARANSPSARALMTSPAAIISHQHHVYGAVTPSSPCIDIAVIQTPSPHSRRRARGNRRRAQYQRNFAVAAEDASVENGANLTISGSTNANTNTNAKVLPHRHAGGRHLDLTVITSWRAPQAEVVAA